MAMNSILLRGLGCSLLAKGAPAVAMAGYIGCAVSGAIVLCAGGYAYSQYERYREERAYRRSNHHFTQMQSPRYHNNNYMDQYSYYDDCYYDGGGYTGRYNRRGSYYR